MGQFKGKKAIFLEKFEATMGNISKAAAAADTARQTIYKWRTASPTFTQAMDDVREALIDDVESELLQKIKAGDLGAICFFLKCQAKHRGYVENGRAIQKPGSVVVSMLDSLIAGDVDVLEAAYHIEKAGEPLPKSIEILLQKQVPEEPESGGSITWPSDEELDALAEKAKSEWTKQQSEWLPKRQAEVAEIKAELAELDSFSNENIENERDKKC